MAKDHLERDLRAARTHRPHRPRVDSIAFDGIEVQTLYTPDTEAPAEFVLILSALRALCTAEVVTHTPHKLYTLRGAQVRDALAWAKAIDAMLARWGADTEVIFASHHWPPWSNVTIDGDAGAFRAMLEHLDDFGLWFNIVTP